MIMYHRSVRHIDDARREQLTRLASSRSARRLPRLRIALASVLAGLARRLAPELPEHAVLRTRAAPN